MDEDEDMNEESEDVENEEEEDEESNQTSTTSTTTTSTTSTTNTGGGAPGLTETQIREKTEVIHEIESLLEEKKNIENKISSLEKQIYALEGRYLEETHHIGNVIRGWDGYVSGSGALKKLRWREADRIFSQSSSTYQDSINDKNLSDNYKDIGDEAAVIKRKTRSSTHDKLKKRG
ncbi:hypothetical protein DFA_05403 [Cavenderia fasciculata]|uniref:Chromatin modification-related protein MEAF6 n=1 Tax=Cavenderia fasciculata TaxID=261658 RepID=F4PL49_CACFS|nr:uncharacterized protein DFA_05403 [Cavenderia fasciculata]EGG23271.1 hypothetical protein DFA_05403 [Cavenderia fasciculata]|eukprot:XP_004361122.1 hypothetical protein DFA_05403 [Cavenderia fasciculata]